MRDLIPELPDLQRLMMPGGSGTKQQVWSKKCTHEEIPFNLKICTVTESTLSVD